MRTQRRSTDAALIDQVAKYTPGAFTGRVGPGSSVAVHNGVSPLLLAKPDSTHDSSAFVVKLGDSTWGDTSPYGSGQAFLLLSSSSTAASDTSGDGIPGSNTNPVLFRVSADGGVGCAGIHVAPGIRQNQTGAVPSQGIWVQQFGLDAAGVVLSGPNPTYVPAPTLPFLVAESWSGTAYADISATGAIRTFADNGTTAVAAVYPKDTAASGYRAIYLTQNAATAGVGIKAAAAQSAPLLVLTNASAVTMAGFDGAGNGFWQNDAGSGTLAQINAGTTPASGFRASFGAGSTGTVPLIAQAAVSTTVDMFQVKSGSGLVLNRVSSAGHWLQATSTAPTLAEMVDNEWTARVSGSSIIFYARVSGVLKSATLTVT